MVDTNYARAYTEILEILSHFSKENYEKIPVEKIEFYKRNMDKNYNFKIDPRLSLENQNISKEANAIFVTLFLDYYATEEQKVKIKEILELNQKKEEQEKSKKYNPDNMFKNEQNNDNISRNNEQLTIYKKSFFDKFKEFILKIIK